MIRAWWGERFTEAALRIGEVPEGSRLIYSSDGLIPLVVFRNVYIFPGIPRLFKAKIVALREVLAGSPHFRSNLYLSPDESAVADRLTAVDAACPDVKIGSYPRSEGEDHRVWITFESADPDALNAAVDQLLAVLDDKEVVRIDRNQNS